MLPQVLRRIKRHLKYTNFYNCVFMTYDYNYKTLILGDKSKQNMALVWLGVNLLQLACQLYSIHTKASGLAEKAVGITISCAYLLTILLRFEIKADVVPILLLNFILGKENSTKQYGKDVVIISNCLYCGLALIEIAMLLVPISSFALSLITPCFSPLLTSLFCDKDNLNQLQWIYGNIMQFGLAILEFVSCQ
ncbi:hypothetical protein Fcan01_01281, partial [Folsomia candida]